MRIAYTSGPYRAKTLRGVIKNIRAAEEVAIELWKMGYAVICPHTNTQLFDGAFDEGKITYTEDKGKDSHWEGGSIKFIEGDLEMINRFQFNKDIMVMLPDWEASEGALIERKRAFQRGIKVLKWDDPTDRKLIEKLAESDYGYFGTEAL